MQSENAIHCAVRPVPSILNVSKAFIMWQLVPTFFPAYTKRGAEQDLYVVSSGLHCSLHLRNPLAKALDGFGLYTVHELSNMEKKSWQSLDSNPGQLGQEARMLTTVFAAPPPPKQNLATDHIFFEHLDDTRAGDRDHVRLLRQA